MTSLKELETLGGFVPARPIRKEIKFTLNGEELSAVIHVKKISIGEFEALFLGDTEERSRTAKAISVAILLGDEGKEVIPFEKAYKLEPSLAGAMFAAFNEVNLQKKPSSPAKGSSAT